jgi:uncharacterized protein (TIGR02996 family)
MDERGAILSAVLADPHDDTRRLALADWLDEHDQHWHATLVRWQCRVPGTDLDAADFRKAAQRWFRECGGPTVRGDGSVSVRHSARTATKTRYRNGAARPHLTSFVLSRGFVGEVRYERLSGFLAEAQALFAAHPVMIVRIEDRDTGEVAAWHSHADWQNGIATLPPELFAGFWKYGLLPEGADALWPSREEADAALSQLCVAPGRALAGLPQLNNSRQQEK